ncbi:MULTISPECIES: DUF3798 domain-containing protein [Clostridia]|uniref:DUF3798 domain-containing protein n=1 Tax=Clostridia TaxID=186801 RepID=UPI002A7EB21D|nr:MULTISPECIES: DUF3798 domain-containing protein [Clostridia]MDY4596786.1 DUF3798 domain-containing protein [Faecalimonas umbilicata]MDY6231375.1 DUF3798 domain-containing protein [Peptostreptococcus porci]
MKKRVLSMFLALAMTAGLLAGCGETKTPEKEKVETEGKEEGEAYKIGIVTPTLTISEDEFRGAQEMVAKYPDLVVHKTLPEDYQNKEGCISVVTSLADDPEVKYILFNMGMEGIVPAFQKIRETRPDIVSIVTSNDDPELMNEYIDISLGTDWVRRGVTIPTKAKEMGAKTFIHYSFPTHMASESKVQRRDAMKATCEELGMEFVEVTTPDPQTGNGRAAMLQFLREDIPRQIEKYGPDTNIFGTNCPMYDVILDEAFKLKFIVAEQCCPTPTQAYPTVLNLEITPEDLGDYTKINDMITEKAKDADMTGKLSGWAMPSQVYTPQFQVELVKYMHDNNLKPEDVRSVEFLNKFSKEHMAVAADFATAGEGLDNYFLFILEDIYY